MHDQNTVHLDHLFRFYADARLLRVISFYFSRSIGGFALEDPTRPSWFLDKCEVAPGAEVDPVLYNKSP